MFINTGYAGMIFVFVYNFFERIIRIVCVAQKIVAISYTQTCYHITKKSIKNISNFYLICISDYLP